MNSDSVVALAFLTRLAVTRVSSGQVFDDQISGRSVAFFWMGCQSRFDDVPYLTASDLTGDAEETFLHVTRRVYVARHYVAAMIGHAHTIARPASVRMGVKLPLPWNAQKRLTARREGSQRGGPETEVSNALSILGPISAMAG